MRALRQFILLTAIVIGLSMTAAAQRQDNKKPPPKPENRPSIPVKPKNDDKKDKPKDDKRNDRRRPGMAFIIKTNETLTV